MFLSYTPDITAKFDTVFRNYKSHLCTLVSGWIEIVDFAYVVKSFVHAFVHYFFAINLCFNSSIIRFISFFLNLYLTFSSLIFLFPFPPISRCHSLSSLLLSLLSLVISPSVLLFHHSSFFSPILYFFAPTSFATQRAAVKVSLFVWVTTCFIISSNST